jgi:tRNA(Ile2) C34 agmatinyltransferase TiaS
MKGRTNNVMCAICGQHIAGIGAYGWLCDPCRKVIALMHKTWPNKNLAASGTTYFLEARDPLEQDAH